MNYAKISQVAHYARVRWLQMMIWQKSWTRAMNGYPVEQE